MMRFESALFLVSWYSVEARNIRVVVCVGGNAGTSGAIRDQWESTLLSLISLLMQGMKL
jgi:hypothetical protein